MVGYNLKQKLIDFGLFDSNESGKDELQLKECYDVARMFFQGKQSQMRLLCENYLNLSFSKRPTPAFGVSKAFMI